MEDKSKNLNTQTYMPDEEAFQRKLATRNRRGVVGRIFYYFSIGIAITALVTLFANVMNQAFGAVAQSFTIDPDVLAGDERVFEELTTQEYADILVEYEANIRVIVRDRLSVLDDSAFTTSTLRELAPSATYPQPFAELTLGEIQSDEASRAVLVDLLTYNEEATLQQIAPEATYPDGYADATINEINELDNASEIFDEFITLNSDTTLQNFATNPQYVDFGNVTVNEISALEDGDAILAEFLALNLSDVDMRSIVLEEVAELETLQAWGLFDTTFNWEPSAAQQERAQEIVAELETVQTERDALATEIEGLEAQVAELRGAGTEQNRTEIDELNAQISTIRTSLSETDDRLEDLRDELDDLVTANITTDVQAEYCTGEYIAVSDRTPEELLDVMLTPFAEAGCRTELIRYQSWLDVDFLRTPMSSVPAQAGIRTAILGSLLMMVIVITVSLPLGVGTAIYLEEYAQQNFISRLIETNVRTLAGVPSIIYGLLGLAIFVRLFAPVTSGIIFGLNVETREPEQAITVIQDSLGYDDLYEINDEGDYVGVNEDGSLSTEISENLISTFLRLGNVGPSNLYGSISRDVAEANLTSALGIEGEVPNDPEEVVTLGDGTEITVATYNSLVRGLEQFSSFTVNGRTILSASLTLALLILPIVIINAQEALRSVPFAIREASYGLGATKWQTIWRTVLPQAIPGIMTGMILAVSRAVGETAPLIVVGASTFILTDPSGPFSKFTVLPIQIYQWTARPQAQFQFIAAAAIIVLLALVLILNALAIYLRNRYSVRY